MRLGVFFLLLGLAVLPVKSFAFTSIIQTGHNFFCNLTLADSLLQRKQALDELLLTDFSRIRKHNAQLRDMSDDEFKNHMRDELNKMAFCHPMATDLLGILPGRDYLAPLNNLTNIPSAMDRRFSYTVWAYNHFYRSLDVYIKQLQTRLHTYSASWEKQELFAAQSLLARLRGLTPEQLLAGVDVEELIEWSNQQGQSPDRKTIETLAENTGSLKPSVTLYAVKGHELHLYEIDSVHLLFPSSQGAEYYCYERFAPEYPHFARLFNSGKATYIDTLVLGAAEKEELLKFFNAAAGMQVEDFMLADQQGLGMHNSNADKTLQSCLGLAASGKTENHDNEWLQGTAARFEANDSTWLSLMMMLAAKRILITMEKQSEEL